MEIRELAECPGYGVSADGKVWSRWRRGRPGGMHDEWRERKCQIGTDGYFRVMTRDLKTWGVHRLVALAFIPNPEAKPQINHIDGNPRNNCVQNLEWCTGSENAKHRYHVLGVATNFAKLTWNDIPEIRTRIASGHRRADIASDFGVSTSTIKRIK